MHQTETILFVWYFQPVLLHRSFTLLNYSRGNTWMSRISCLVQHAVLFVKWHRGPTVINVNPNLSAELIFMDLNTSFSCVKSLFDSYCHTSSGKVTCGIRGNICYNRFFRKTGADSTSPLSPPHADFVWSICSISLAPSYVIVFFYTEPLK